MEGYIFTGRSFCRIPLYNQKLFVEIFMIMVTGSVVIKLFKVVTKSSYTKACTVAYIAMVLCYQWDNI
jgi:hypothetical protein